MTEKHGVRLIRIMDAKKNDGKMFDVAGYRNRAKLLLSTLLFLRATAYVVCSFVKNRTRVSATLQV